MNKPLVSGLVILGVVFLLLAVFYFITPANHLPAFFPGHDLTTKIHYKHGIGAIILAFAAFIFAWFQSGKKSMKEK